MTENLHAEKIREYKFTFYNVYDGICLRDSISTISLILHMFLITGTHVQ